MMGKDLQAVGLSIIESWHDYYVATVGIRMNAVRAATAAFEGNDMVDNIACRLGRVEDDGILVLLMDTGGDDLAGILVPSDVLMGDKTIEDWMAEEPLS